MDFNILHVPRSVSILQNDWDGNEFELQAQKLRVSKWATCASEVYPAAPRDVAFMRVVLNPKKCA